MTTEAQIAELWRYPVKSMGGERCDSLELDGRGAVGDRAFAVRTEAGKFGSGKTTRRFQRIHGLLEFRAHLKAQPGAQSGAGDPKLYFPDGRDFLVSDSELSGELSEMLGQSVSVAAEEQVSYLDAGPVHLITTAGLRWLTAGIGAGSVEAERFRANLVIDCPGDVQVELDWLGRTLQVGSSVQLRVTQRTERCRMVRLPQVELSDNAAVLRHLAEENDRCFGVYAEVNVPGTIRLGDAVVPL